MIEFNCGNCGEKFSVPETDAGKRGYCPRCKEPLVVPEADSVYDLTLLDFPQENQSREQVTVEQEVEETVPIEETDSVKERRLPWPIDILLYLISKAGLAIITIVMGIPFVFFLF